VAGFAFGFILIVYGFNVISTGIPGARIFTSQFLATNLLLAGSVLVFASLYYLLKPPSPLPARPSVLQPAGPRPDIGVETIVEEETPPKPGFYRTIEYIGYFFTILGLVSAADLVLQVFIRSTYNEARWWVEALLVTFGVLSYTIFGSVGKLGLQEEAKLGPAPFPKPTQQAAAETHPQATVSGTEASELMRLNLAEFTRNSAGEYEKHLTGERCDMFRVDRELVTVWREDRRGMRAVYLAGPYELTKRMMEEYLGKGEELRVGSLALSTDMIRGLLDLTDKSAGELPEISASTQHEV